MAEGHGLDHLDDIPGVETVEDPANHVDAMMKPGSGALKRTLSNSRTAWYEDGVVIIHNSEMPYRSTVFTQTFDYFLALD